MDDSTVVAILSRLDPGAVANENANATPTGATEPGLAPASDPTGSGRPGDLDERGLLEASLQGASLGSVYTAPFSFMLRATVNGAARNAPVVVDDLGQLDALARALALVSSGGGFDAAASSSCRVEARIRLSGTPAAATASSIRALEGELLELFSDALPEQLTLCGPLALTLAPLQDDALLVSLALEAPADEHIENALYGAACAIAPALARLAGVSPNVRVARRAVERFCVRCRIGAGPLIDAALAPAGFRHSPRAREQAICRAAAALAAGERDRAIAAAHNGLIASSIAAVALAFGNAPARALADAERHAARNGGCEPLCTWRSVGGAVEGELELPLAITAHGRQAAPGEVEAAVSAPGPARDIGVLAACVGMAASVVALSDAVRVRVHDERGALSSEREQRRVRSDAEPPSVASL